jgi:hypothetical protein
MFIPPAQTPSGAAAFAGEETFPRFSEDVRISALFIDGPAKNG